MRKNDQSPQGAPVSLEIRVRAARPSVSECVLRCLAGCGYLASECRHVLEGVESRGDFGEGESFERDRWREQF